jgi:hypothetical protein
MSIYRLRYFFDPGSGICLWAGNDAARSQWDYPIDARDLPLSENTWRFAHHLCSWYDTSIDWAYPPDPSPWDATERARFNLSAQRFLSILQDQLGPDFEVLDESGTSVAA